MFPVPWNRRDPHIGDLLADWLTSYGITEEWATRYIFRPIFRLQHCPCGKIRRWLNRRYWLHKFARWLRFKVEYDDGRMF